MKSRPIKIIRQNDVYLIVVQKEKDNKVYHASFKIKTLEHIVDNQIELPKDVDKKLLWTESRSKLDDDKGKRLSFRSMFNFGLYKGFEIGLVYAFDMYYVGWCIRNIENFAIEDLAILQEIGVFKHPEKYESYRDKFPDVPDIMSVYSGIIDLYKDLPVLNPKIRLPEEVYYLNEIKLK